MSGILQSLLASFPSGVAGFFLYGWGDNGRGQIGDNTTVNKSSPTQVGALSDWATVSAGSYESAALKTDGTIWTWGHNNYGQLGHGDVVNRSSPVQVGALTTWTSISISSRVGGAIKGSSVALKTDGTLWAWGAYGVSGQNDFVNRSSPVQIGSDTNWASASVTNASAFAIKTTGTLWAWGDNGFGKLGLGQATTNPRSPAQVGALSNWAAVGGGELHTIFLKTNGTLWSTGRNVNGELGQGDTTNRSSPVQIGALTTWSSVAAGPFASAAIKTDGTLWTWGWNYYGWLGLNDRTQRNSPVQVGSLTNWQQVAVARYNMAAVKTDGTLWSWGSNSDGALGQNNVIKRSSPIQVGSDTNWGTTSANSGSGFMALKK